MDELVISDNVIDLNKVTARSMTNDPDAEARMERARMYVTRGMVRKTIKTKCKLSDKEFADLNKWARKVTGRKR